MWQIYISLMRSVLDNAARNAILCAPGSLSQHYKLLLRITQHAILPWLLFKLLLSFFVVQQLRVTTQAFGPSMAK